MLFAVESKIWPNQEYLSQEVLVLHGSPREGQGQISKVNNKVPHQILVPPTLDEPPQHIREKTCTRLFSVTRVTKLR